MVVQPMLPRCRTITPTRVVEDAARLIQFLAQAFGVRKRFRLPE